jgi:predicted S18 family serine protease
MPFLFGLVLGFTFASMWIEEPPRLELLEGEAYVREVTIVGVDKETGKGRLAVLRVELRAGGGDILINIPPYETEDVQQSFLDAKVAVTALTGKSLDTVDFVISVENVEPGTTITGPSMGAAAALLMISTIRASENHLPNEVRRDVVVSAGIDSIGRLKPVGDIDEKYETVLAAGDYSVFVVAEDQLGLTYEHPGLEIEWIGNLEELKDLVMR